MQRLIPIALTGAILTAAGAAWAQPSMPGAAATTTSAPAYVNAAAAGDLYEIQSSRLVLEDAKTEGVRGFAQMMIDHHTRTTRDLTAAAGQAGVATPPPALDPRKASMIAQLRASQGMARERTYLTQQAAAHDEAHALHSGYAKNGDNEALRAVAAKATPIIDQHRTALRQMKEAKQ